MSFKFEWHEWHIGNDADCRCIVLAMSTDILQFYAKSTKHPGNTWLCCHLWTALGWSKKSINCSVQVVIYVSEHLNTLEIISKISATHMCDWPEKPCKIILNAMFFTQSNILPNSRINLSTQKVMELWESKLVGTRALDSPLLSLWERDCCCLL